MHCSDILPAYTLHSQDYLNVMQTTFCVTAYIVQKRVIRLRHSVSRSVSGSPLPPDLPYITTVGKES
ncbi:MAG: hypothetical protein KatS3mg054_0876 [Chloroflexus sp.]|nr:MAG: hypothetical protein KatS3mg054_0876 [Chloroflexus sp.]